MSSAIELTIEFDLGGITSMAEAARLAEEHLHALGVSDSGYGYTTAITVTPEVMVTGEALPCTWSASVTVRARPR